MTMTVIWWEVRELNNEFCLALLSLQPVFFRESKDSADNVPAFKARPVKNFFPFGLMKICEKNPGCNRILKGGGPDSPNLP